MRQGLGVLTKSGKTLGVRSTNVYNLPSSTLAERGGGKVDQQHDSEYCLGLFLYYSLNDSGHPSAGEPQFGPDDPRTARVLSVVDPRFAFSMRQILLNFGGLYYYCVLRIVYCASLIV